MLNLCIAVFFEAGPWLSPRRRWNACVLTFEQDRIGDPTGVFSNSTAEHICNCSFKLLYARHGSVDANELSTCSLLGLS